MAAKPWLLVDAEILAWRVAWRAPDDRAVLRRFEARLARLRAVYAAGEIVLALSSRPLFRKALWPGYKAGRRPAPPRVAALLAALDERGDAARAPALEADDVLGVLATGGAIGAFGPPAGAAIVVSADKDLSSVPGRHARPDGRVETIAPDAANLAHLTQTLTGDAVDGYPGCAGVGPKRAAAILAGVDPGARWSAVVGAFAAASPDGRPASERALLQARLARVLRAGEYDARTGRPRLWRPHGATSFAAS